MSPGRSAGSSRPVDALPARRRLSQDRERLDLLVTLVLMAAALFALCLVLGEVPAMGEARRRQPGRRLLMRGAHLIAPVPPDRPPRSRAVYMTAPNVLPVHRTEGDDDRRR